MATPFNEDIPFANKETFNEQWKHNKSSLRLFLLLDLTSQASEDGYTWLAQREAVHLKSFSLNPTWQLCRLSKPSSVHIRNSRVCMIMIESGE